MMRHANLGAVTDLVWDPAGGRPEVRVEKVRLDDYYGNEEMEKLIAIHQVRQKHDLRTHT